MVHKCSKNLLLWSKLQRIGSSLELWASSTFRWPMITQALKWRSTSPTSQLRQPRSQWLASLRYSSSDSWTTQESSAWNSCTTKLLALSLFLSQSRRPKASRNSSFHSRTWALTWTLILSLLSSGPLMERILRKRSWSQSTASASTANPTNWKLPQTNYLSWRCRWKWIPTFYWTRTRWSKKCWRTLWTSCLWRDSRTPRYFSVTS